MTFVPGDRKRLKGMRKKRLNLFAKRTFFIFFFKAVRKLYNSYTSLISTICNSKVISHTIFIETNIIGSENLAPTKIRLTKFVHFFFKFNNFETILRVLFNLKVDQKVLFK